MSLEDKINSILCETIVGYRNVADEEKQPLLNQKVEKLKQAFAEEGYIKEIDISLPVITPYVPAELMTGPEWYERFEEELYTPKKQIPGFKTDEERCRFYRDGGANFMYNQALKAAKKASGVSL